MKKVQLVFQRPTSSLPAAHPGMDILPPLPAGAQVDKQAKGMVLDIALLIPVRSSALQPWKWQ